MLMLMQIAGIESPAAPQVTDADISAIAKGDKEALTRVYHATSSAVYGFALSILCSHHEAEDVMQDCYLRIYDKAADYVPQGKPMAWILTIVKNMAFMKLRARSKDGGPIEDNDSIYNPGSSTEDRIVLKAALLKLSEQERQIITLHALGGMKHKEIAQMLNLPQPTVITKYRRALNKLKEIIGEGE